MINLKDKWALITGASRGIGEQVARSLAQKGLNLVLHSRKIEHTEKLAQELKGHGIQCISLEADLNNPLEAVKLALKAEDITGGISVLYNNAAIMTQYRTDYISTIEDYTVSFNVNVISLIKICDIILPKMIERGFGRIINVTSGIKDEPELTPYAISKAAVDKYVKDLSARMKGLDVLMNLMDPGWLKTDLGGPNAPNEVQSVIPGALVPVFLEKSDGSGKLYHAQDYRN